MARTGIPFPYVVKNFSIDGLQWWPIAAPIACNYWSLRGAADMHVRSDPDDATTEDDVPVGSQEACISGQTSFRHFRYQANDVVIYVKSQAGAQVVVARFVE